MQDKAGVRVTFIFFLLLIVFSVVVSTIILTAKEEGDLVDQEIYINELRE